MTGLHDDLGHLFVRIGGGSQFLHGRLVLEGQNTIVVDLIQDQAQGVSIGGAVDGSEHIVQLRRGVAAAVLAGQSRILDRVQADEAQIADLVILVVGNKDVIGLQIHIQMTGPAAGGQGCAQVQTQIDSFQVGHGTLLQMTLQGTAVGSQQIDVIAQAVVVHGDNLPCFTGHKAARAGQLLMQTDFLHHTVGQLLEIIQGTGCILECAGQQEGVQLALGCGDGKDLDDVFVIRILTNCGTAAHAVMAADGVAHLKTVQQGRNKFML